jgi:hypothetical protein
LICDDLIYLIEPTGFKLLQQISFPTKNYSQVKAAIKPMCAQTIGDNYILYGMSKHESVYLYRFDS